jgi:hypothetical protein
MTGYLIAAVAVLILGAVAIPRLLVRITAHGGTSEKDASSISNQVISQTEVLRGKRTPDGLEWDGQGRLAEPTTEGLILWPEPPRQRGERKRPS